MKIASRTASNTSGGVGGSFAESIDSSGCGYCKFPYRTCPSSGGSRGDWSRRTGCAAPAATPSNSPTPSSPPPSSNSSATPWPIHAVGNELEFVSLATLNGQHSAARDSRLLRQCNRVDQVGQHQSCPNAPIECNRGAVGKRHRGWEDRRDWVVAVDVHSWKRNLNRQRGADRPAGCIQSADQCGDSSPRCRPSVSLRTISCAKPMIQRNTTLAMKRMITKGKLEEFVLIKPSLPLQQKFAALVERVERVSVPCSVRRCVRLTPLRSLPRLRRD